MAQKLKGSSCLPTSLSPRLRGEENSNVHEGQGHAKAWTLASCAPSGQQGLAGASPRQSLSSQLSLLLRRVYPNQGLWGSHVVLRIASAPAATGSSPFPKVVRPLSRPAVWLYGDPGGFHWDWSHLRLSP